MQILEVWCRNEVVDPVSEIEQRREILPEEFLEGWLRDATVSGQQVNALFYLLTAHADTRPCVPKLILTTDTLLDNEILWVDGGAISLLDTPVLHSRYGATFPTLQSTAPSGWKYVVRKQ